MATESTGKSRGGASNLRPWKPGQSGNPGGRKKADPNVAEILRKGGVPAAEYMVALVQDEEARPADRQRAAEYVLDRLLGKAAQPIIADIHQAEEPLTLAQMLERTRELLEDG